LAGLFGHSMAELRSVALGFRADAVVGFSQEFPEQWTRAQRNPSRERLLTQVAAIPVVSAVSYGSPGPFLNGTSSATFRVVGEGPVTSNDWVNLQVSGPHYLTVIGATLRDGRDIEDTDTAKSRRVAIVNEAFLRKYIPNETAPLRRQLALGTDTMDIVGVVADIAHQGVRAKPSPTVYMPGTQTEGNWEPMIVARSAGSPEALIASVRRLGANITEPRPIRRQVEQSLLQDRLLATVGGFFGLVALALAAVGLYGVVAYGTARRLREIGIRVALGARRGSVIWMVLRDALLLVAAGLAIGLPASYAAARQVASLLFGLKPDDTFAFTMTAGALLVVGLAAAVLPARRAAGVEPLSVLRAE
jgi:predicted permease